MHPSVRCNRDSTKKGNHSCVARRSWHLVVDEYEGGYPTIPLDEWGGKGKWEYSTSHGWLMMNGCCKAWLSEMVFMDEGPAWQLSCE